MGGGGGVANCYYRDLTEIEELNYDTLRSQTKLQKQSSSPWRARENWCADLPRRHRRIF